MNGDGDEDEEKIIAESIRVYSATSKTQMHLKTK